MRPLPGSSQGLRCCFIWLVVPPSGGQISVTNSWFKPASQTQLGPPLFSLPISPPLLLTWTLGSHSTVLSSLGGCWLRITRVFDCSWGTIFIGKTDSSSSQADFIPFLGFLPYFLHLSPVSTLLLSLFELRLSGETPFSEVGCFFFKSTVFIFHLGLSGKYSGFNSSALCSVWLIYKHWVLNVLYIKFQIGEWKHFKKK